jgi:transposase
MAVLDLPYVNRYPSDLSEEEWQIIRPLIPGAACGLHGFDNRVEGGLWI